MTRAHLGFAATALVLALALAGCGGAKGTLVPNLPPETVVFVNGPVDTLNHVARLRWFGSDPDGKVVRFEFRWVYPAGQAPAGYDSSAWLPTTRTDSTFILYAPQGYAMPTFVVRAVDNQGLADPTPARETFQFTNAPPTVHLTGLPLPTTFPVTTIQWTASDPDGDIGRATYLVWLDGNEANATPVGATNQFTLPPTLFSDGAGGYRGGVHTVHIRAVDDGGAVSPPDSATWNVMLPQGNVLLVDDDPDAFSPAVDPMYTEAFDRQLGGPSFYTKVKLEANNPFRSPQDVVYAFGFFQSIFWYQENSPLRSATLAMTEPGIRAALAAGHNVYLCGTTIVGTNGTLAGDSFLSDLAGADSLYFNARVQTTNFSIPNASLLWPGQAPYDTLRAVTISQNVDALALHDSTEAAFKAPPIVLDSLQTGLWPVGVDRVPAGGAGRFVLLTFPLRFLGGIAPNNPLPTPDSNYGVRTVRRILYRFGQGTAP